MRKFRILGFSYSLNAPAHRERPDHVLSDLTEPQHGRDAVAQIVGLLVLFLPLDFPTRNHKM